MPVRGACARPLPQEVPVLVEDLHAVVAGIVHVYVAGLVDGDALRHEELTRGVSLAAPLQNVRRWGGQSSRGPAATWAARLADEEAGRPKTSTVAAPATIRASMERRERPPSIQPMPPSPAAGPPATRWLLRAE